jgi:hypothetical protein
MTNNLALFVTHHIFLTDEQISSVVSGEKISCVGHCVPVWVDAKTGKTTEPAKEIFCSYDIFNSEERINDVELVAGKGYELWLPRASNWQPPPEIDFESMAEWTSEKRNEFLKERDMWWFNNPRPPDADNLSRGYLRFEVKKKDLKMGRRLYSSQHMVEISSVKVLSESLTS